MKKKLWLVFSEDLYKENGMYGFFIAFTSKKEAIKHSHVTSGKCTKEPIVFQFNHPIA